MLVLWVAKIYRLLEGRTSQISERWSQANAISIAIRCNLYIGRAFRGVILGFSHSSPLSANRTVVQFHASNRLPSRLIVRYRIRITEVAGVCRRFVVLCTRSIVTNLRPRANGVRFNRVCVLEIDPGCGDFLEKME